MHRIQIIQTTNTEMPKSIINEMSKTIVQKHKNVKSRSKKH